MLAVSSRETAQDSAPSPCGSLHVPPQRRYRPHLGVRVARVFRLLTFGYQNNATWTSRYLEKDDWTAFHAVLEQKITNITIVVSLPFIPTTAALPYPSICNRLG